MNQKKQTWKRSLILFTFVLALIPTTVFAGVILIAVLGITISSPGTTIAERVDQNQIEVVTQGLQSSGTIACQGDPQCLATGLDEATLLIDENLRFRLDETTMSVTGAVNGQIQGLDAGAPSMLDGDIVGSATCVGAAPTPCQTLQLDIQVSGVLIGNQGNDFLYQLEQKLTATLTGGNGQSPVVTWAANENGTAIKVEQPPG